LISRDVIPGGVSSACHGIHSCPTPTPSHWSETFLRTATRNPAELGVCEGPTLRLHEGRLTLACGIPTRTSRAAALLLPEPQNADSLRSDE